MCVFDCLNVCLCVFACLCASVTFVCVFAMLSVRLYACVCVWFGPMCVRVCLCGFLLPFCIPFGASESAAVVGGDCPSPNSAFGVSAPAVRGSHCYQTAQLQRRALDMSLASLARAEAQRAHPFFSCALRHHVGKAAPCCVCVCKPTCRQAGMWTDIQTDIHSRNGKQKNTHSPRQTN